MRRIIEPADTMKPIHSDTMGICFLFRPSDSRDLMHEKMIKVQTINLKFRFFFLSFLHSLDKIRCNIIHKQTHFVARNPDKIVKWPLKLIDLSTPSHFQTCLIRFFCSLSKWHSYMEIETVYSVLCTSNFKWHFQTSNWLSNHFYKSLNCAIFSPSIYLAKPCIGMLIFKNFIFWYQFNFE